MDSPEWEGFDPKLKELSKNPLKIPHLDTVLQEIPLDGGVFSILGPRQVGKSTLLRLIAKKFLEVVSPRQVILIEGDEIETWRELKSILKDSILPLPDQGLRGCLLIDEITSIDQWHRAIKSLADQGQLSGVAVIYTGSSMVSLKEAGELFPGRRGRHAKTSFEIFPAPYSLLSGHLSLEEYFIVGGFPWAVNEYLRLRVVPGYVGEIYWSWLKGEFLKRGKSDLLLKHMVQALARRVPTGFSHNSMAKEMGIASNETARQYLELLKDCFAIREAMWMDPIKRIVAPRKNRKYYPIDPLLFHLFKSGGYLSGLNPQTPLTPEQQGPLAEGIACQEIKRRSGEEQGYWLGKREIDFVPSFIEVKYQAKVGPHEFQWFEKHFPAKFSLLVLTKDDSFHIGRVRGMPLKDWLLHGSPV